MTICLLPAVIHIRLLNILARRSALGVPEFDVEARAGITVRDLVAEAGLDDSQVQLVIVNGRLSQLDAELKDGDVVVLSSVIAGG